MNPYNVLEYEYNGVEKETTDQELKEIYSKKSEEYKKVINNIYTEYDFPKEYKALIDIDIAYVVEKKYEKINPEIEILSEVERKYEEIENARIQLIENMEKLIALDKAYDKIKTVDLRLIYACENEIDKNGSNLDLIESIQYETSEILDTEETGINNSSPNIEKVGRLEYKNCTGAYIGYIIKYKIKDESGTEQFVFSDFSEKDLNNPEFIKFLNRTIFNNDYIEYALKNNAGYLGIPKKNKNGDFIIEFDAEDIVAAKKYEELIQKEDNKDKEDEEISI